MSSQVVLSSAYWNNTANGDFLRANTEFIGAYVDDMNKNSVISKLCTIQDLNEINPHFASYEANGTVGIVPDGQNVPGFEFGKGRKTIFNTKTIATRIEMTNGMLISVKDPTRDAMPLIMGRTKAVMAGFRKTIESRIINYFDNGFVASVNPITEQTFVAPDGLSLINANHQYQTGGTFDNTLTNAVLSASIIDQLYEKAANTVGADGLPINLMPKYMFVRTGSAVEREAKRLFGYNNGNNGNQYHTPTLGNVNIYEGGEMTIISSPYFFSDAANAGANRGKAYYFMADFEADGVIPNPLRLIYNTRPQAYGEFKDGDNMSVYQNFKCDLSDGVAYLPLGIWGSRGY